jgi:hypothetical protein
VDSLWTAGQFKIFLTGSPVKIHGAHIVRASSSVLSLEAAARAARMLPSIINLDSASHTGVRSRRRSHVNVHRFAETINGREYLIEVSSVGADKWRAQIARTPGGSAALMPFYGKTPDEAAGGLSRWLALAHGLKRC